MGTKKYTIDIPKRFYREDNPNLSRRAVTRTKKGNIAGWFERIYATGLRYVLYLNDTLVSEIQDKNVAYTEFNDLCRAN